MAQTFDENDVSSARVISNSSGEEPASRLWVDYRRDRFKNRAHKWRLAYEFYTGNVLDHPDDFIVRRVQGESKDAWEERAALADFGGHFASLADKFNGMADSADDGTSRIWQPEEQTTGFGDPEDRDSAAHRLKEDYDGDGTDIEAFWKEVRGWLIVLHECWILAEGPVTREDENGREETVSESHLTLLMPWEVVNTFYRDGSLEAVLVKEQVDTRQSIKDSPEKDEQYVLYSPDGWERYRVEVSNTGDGNAKRVVRQIGKGMYGSGAFVSREGQPIPPVFKAELPLKRFVGYMAAKKEQAIFNKESERDFAARMSCFNKLVPRNDEGLSDDNYEGLVDNLIKGSTVLQHAVQYENPSSEPVQSNSEILQEKKETFYRVMFQKYEDEAKQATATAIRQDAFSGQDSFLNLVVGAEDEAENMAMWLMGQIEFPSEGPEVWVGFGVERSRNFQPVDPEEMADKLKERYFGRTKSVPVGESGKIDAAKKIADQDGLNYDPEEIETDVRSENRRRAQEEAALQQIAGGAQ